MKGGGVRGQGHGGKEKGGEGWFWKIKGRRKKKELRKD